MQETVDGDFHIDTRSKILEMGFQDVRAVDAALRHCRNVDRNCSVNNVIDWLLENEVTTRLHLQHEVKHTKRDKGGLDSVFHRERKRLEDFVRLLDSGFYSVSSLLAMADDIEELANGLVDRKRINRETEDDIMDDMLNKTQGTGMSGLPDTPDLPSKAKEIGRILVACTKSAYGVLSVSEAFRIYNRSRFRDACSPEEFLEACKLFDSVGVAMSLERGALFASDGAADALMSDVVRVVSQQESRGLSRVDISARVGMPVGITALYLNRAESRQIIVRDDTPRGIYYHMNEFSNFNPIGSC